MNKMLQQDNATCYCSTYTKKFLNSDGINVIPNCSSCPPDLNIIENTWAILKDKVRRRVTSNLKELRTFVEEEFNEIPDSVILNLYESIPKRISEVLRRKYV